MVSVTTMSNTEIQSKSKKRESTLSKLSAFISDVIPTVGFGRFCRVNYTSVMGKWLTFFKLMALVLIPVLTASAFTIYSLADTVHLRENTIHDRIIMSRSVNLGHIIYKIQKERDMSILYLSKIGSGTKLLVIQEYENTDTAIADMRDWPEEFASNPNQHFRSKNEFVNYINQHRAKLEINSSLAYGEVVFYTDIVDIIMDWMVTSIKESAFGNIWKTLVVFHKITRCMLDTGIERAFGAMFFAQGNFPDLIYYDLYFRSINRFNYSYSSASSQSDLVDHLFHERTEHLVITTSINMYRQIVKDSNFTAVKYTSALDAQFYFDNMTLRVDYMFNLNELVSKRVILLMNATLSRHMTHIVIYGVIAGIVIVFYPVILYMFDAQSRYHQAYYKVLVKVSNDLDNEKNRTDSILYQLLPKSVVWSLKMNSKVDSEYFESATIMFTSIVNFTRLSIEFTSMDLIECLNVLFTAFDEMVEQYGVYKVETINDNYMVVSGVPVRNGTRHASEIAYLALDIRHMISEPLYTIGMPIPIQLRLGISTGSVSAGVVGNVMLRYCLFGDTVNIASRMKSYSKPNRIHISESTCTSLAKTGDFRIKSRGLLQIKGKGELETYWLLGTKYKSEYDISFSNSRLSAELSDSSNDDIGPGPGPSSIVTTRLFPASSGKSYSQKIAEEFRLGPSSPISDFRQRNDSLGPGRGPSTEEGPGPGPSTQEVMTSGSGADMKRNMSM